MSTAVEESTVTRISQNVIDHVGTDNMTDGKLPAYAWPGGYPLYYITNQGSVLCPEHANVEGEYDDEEITGADVNWEDEDLWCEHGHKIELAYGDSDD